MTQDFQLIGLATVDFSLTDKIELPADLSKAPISIAVHLQLALKQGEKLLVQQLSVKFSNDSNEMVRLSVQAAYHIKGLPESDDALKTNESVRLATLVTVGAVDGILQEKLSESPIATLHMPIPNLERLYEKAEILHLD